MAYNTYHPLTHKSNKGSCQEDKAGRVC